MVGQCLKNYLNMKNIVNNLYGWASQKLPVNGFKWIENNEINKEFIKNYDENNAKGYILEVDVKYP